VGVEVQAHAEERGALLERVRRRGLQIVAERHERARPLLARELAHAELHFRDALSGKLPEDDDFVLADFVMRDLEGPCTVQRLIEARDDAVALHVIEQAIAPLALADLRGLERPFQKCTVHSLLPPLVAVSSVRSAPAASRINSGRPPSASSVVSPSTRSPRSCTAERSSVSSRSAARTTGMTSRVTTSVIVRSTSGLLS